MTKAIASETLAETAHAERRLPVSAPAPNRPPIKRIADIGAALLVSTSLLVATAQPSMADKRGDDFAKALGAALILGLAISALDNKTKAEAAPAPTPQPKPRPHPKPRYEAIPTVPAVCAIEIDSNEGRAVTVFAETCMREEGFDYRLPDCARNIRIYGRSDQVYSEQCLRDAGFRTRSHN